MEDMIEVKKFYTVPIQRVWDAISKAEEMSQWFMKADFKAEVGFAYRFSHEMGDVTGKVLEVDSPHKLVYTWAFEQAPGGKVDTTVEWKLEEKDNGTALTITHTGLTHYPKEAVQEMFKKTSEGWAFMSGNLDNYLAK